MINRSLSLLRRFRRRYYRVCLVWVLCVCAWRGPVPIVHSHALDELAGGNDFNLSLAQHIARCHSHGTGHSHEVGCDHTQLDLQRDPTERSHAESGWHVHFVLPLAAGDVDTGGDKDDDGPKPALSLAWPCTMPEFASDGVLDTHASPLLGIVLADDVLSLAADAPHRIPLEPPRPGPIRRSLQVTLCVARC